MNFHREQFFECGACVALDAHTIVLGVGPMRWSSSAEEGSFYFPDFFLEEKTPWCKPKSYHIMSLEEFREFLGKGESQVLSWKPGDKTLYEKQFLDLQSAIESRNLRKGVLYSFQRATAKVQVGAYLRSLASAASQNGLHLFGFWDAKQGMLGATPEVLFSLTEDFSKLQTMAVAGSARGRLDRDSKLIEEHNFVIEGIKESLSLIGECVAGATKPRSFGELSHFVTPITACLRAKIPFASIVSILHPTPALGGYPKELAKDWLRTVAAEIPRGRYGAPVGVITGSCASCLVAIRGIQWEGSEIQMGAGGGLVQKSTFAQEWEEIQWKWHAIEASLTHLSTK